MRPTDILLAPATEGRSRGAPQPRTGESAGGFIAEPTDDAVDEAVLAVQSYEGRAEIGDLEGGRRRMRGH